jgi:hypothetical protein
MIKTHFAASDTSGSDCGRGTVTNTDPYRVTCGHCKNRPAHDTALHAAAVARKAAFEAQVPRTYREPWRDGNITCRECEGDLFRSGDRTCYGHYDNFHCANCGHVESRLTETGMSF